MVETADITQQSIAELITQDIKLCGKKSYLNWQWTAPLNGITWYFRDNEQLLFGLENPDACPNLKRKSKPEHTFNLELAKSGSAIECKLPIINEWVNCRFSADKNELGFYEILIDGNKRYCEGFDLRMKHFIN